MAYFVLGDLQRLDGMMWLEQLVEVVLQKKESPHLEPWGELHRSGNLAALQNIIYHMLSCSPVVAKLAIGRLCLPGAPLDIVH